MHLPARSIGVRASVSDLDGNVGDLTEIFNVRQNDLVYFDIVKSERGTPGDTDFHAHWLFDGSDAGLTSSDEDVQRRQLINGSGNKGGIMRRRRIVVVVGLAIVAGIIGLIMSIIFRMELAEPGNQILGGEYWRGHLRQPVRFADSIRTVAQCGCDIVLELGPQPILTAMAASCWPA